MLVEQQVLHSQSDIDAVIGGLPLSLRTYYSGGGGVCGGAAMISDDELMDDHGLAERRSQHIA